jgi:hypothetical protein
MFFCKGRSIATAINTPPDWAKAPISAFCHVIVLNAYHLMLTCYIPARMGDQGNDDDQVAQRRDALLLRLLKTPPQPRPKRERKASAPQGKKRPAQGRARRKG